MSRSFGAMSLTSVSAISISPELAFSSPAMMFRQRGLAAAGRTDQHGEVAAVDLEVYAL